MTADYTQTKPGHMFVVQYAQGAKQASEMFHAPRSISGVGSEAWYGDTSLDLKAVYGTAALTTSATSTQMGGGDVLTLETKVQRAVAAKLGLHP